MRQMDVGVDFKRSKLEVLQAGREYVKLQANAHALRTRNHMIFNLRFGVRVEAHILYSGSVLST